MLFYIFSGGDWKDILISLLLTLPVMAFALSIHETAHGYVAWKCGDPTAYNLGRLTLNPAKHLDPIGFFMLLIFGFGWAKAVPINTRNFCNPKRGMLLSSAAGPLANLLVGMFNTLLLGVTLAFWAYFSTLGTLPKLIQALYWLYQLFYFGALVNFIYCFFNLIPIPPFDGSRIALAFLPPKTYFGIMRYERQIMYGLLIALFVCSYLFDVSPFSWLAERLTDAIAWPVAKLVLRLL